MSATKVRKQLQSTVIERITDGNGSFHSLIPVTVTVVWIPRRAKQGTHHSRHKDHLADPVSLIKPVTYVKEQSLVPVNRF
jgi:hypothetical protein